MKIKDAIYKCDFCLKDSTAEYPYIFKAAWDDSSHTFRLQFGLCLDCHTLISGNKVSKALKRILKFK